LENTLRLLKSLLASVISASIAFTPMSASALTGEPGQVFFRYKSNMSFTDVPDTQGKDVTAFYVADVGVSFAELLPLKPEWQDDTWTVVSGTLPAGITFNGATRRFGRSPMSPQASFPTSSRAITCAHLTSGGLMCWGLNERGQNGEGYASSYRTRPTATVGLTSGVKSYSGNGYAHGCATMLTGKAMCWGSGFLGDGSGSRSNSIPVNVDG
jgi:hypothetical protein